MMKDSWRIIHTLGQLWDAIHPISYVYPDKLSLRYSQHLVPCTVFVPLAHFSIFLLVLPRLFFHLTCLHSNYCFGICSWVIPRSSQLHLYPTPKESTCHHLVLVMNSILTDGPQSSWLFQNQLALFHPHPLTPILATVPFSIPGREQCEAVLTVAHALSVFHLSTFLWGLTHAVDIMQHLAGLMWGNSKSDMSSSIILAILTPCISCGFPAKVSDLL